MRCRLLLEKLPGGSTKLAVDCQPCILVTPTPQGYIHPVMHWILKDINATPLVDQWTQQNGRWNGNHMWHFFLCQLPQRISRNKLSSQRSHRVRGVSNKTTTDQKMLSSQFLLRGMVLSRSDVVNATLYSISSDSLVVAICDPPAPAAGHICRHDRLCPQGPPPPNATVTHLHLFSICCNLTWQLRDVPQWTAPGTFTNTKQNNSFLKEWIQSIKVFLQLGGFLAF